MQEEETAVKIDECKGCEINISQTENGCKRWIRRSNKIKAIPEAMIDNKKDKINVEKNQIKRYRSIAEWKRGERKMVGMKQVSNLKITLIRKQ